MLRDKNAAANLAVKNLETARTFYGQTLGLTQEDSGCEGLLTFRSGNTVINVYESQYAGTNKATAVTWDVGDELEAIVGALEDRGVAFEHYDMPDMKREGHVHIGGNMKVAWFKDPDGNILNIFSA